MQSASPEFSFGKLALIKPLTWIRHIMIYRYVIHDLKRILGWRAGTAVSFLTKPMVTYYVFNHQLDRCVDFNCVTQIRVSMGVTIV